MSLIPQPRGRPRDGHTWDMKTGAWIPNASFNGIPPPPKKAIEKKKKFRYRIAGPPKIYSHEEMEIQRRMWIQHKQQQHQASYEETRKQNEEYAAAQRKKVEEETAAAQRKQAEDEKIAAAANLQRLRMEEEEKRRIYNLPTNQLKRIRDQHLNQGGNPQCKFYCVDANNNFYEAESNAAPLACSEPSIPNIPQAPDELRDTVWPNLHKLNEELKVIQHVLQCLSKKRNTTRYLAQIDLRIQRREEDKARVLKKIAALGEKQKRLLNWTNYQRSKDSS